MGRKASINKIKRDNSKSKNIESALVMYLYQKSHSPITTRFTGMGLQECDVISVSKSDYIYEYEIKISRQDFKKDFLKEKHNHILNEKFTYVGKGEQLFRVCNYFNYVVPNGLVSIEEVEALAGGDASAGNEIVGLYFRHIDECGCDRVDCSFSG